MSPALLLIAALNVAPQGEVLDFTATWCGPCQQMRPVVERLHREGLPIRQVDVDQNRELANRYNIQGIPAFVLVVNGREVERKVGGQSEAALRQMLAKIPAAPAEAEGAPASKRRGWLGGILGKEEQQPATPPQFDSNVRGQSPEAPPAQPVAQPSGSAAVSAPAAGKPLETAVRIRVTDEKGTDFGSGTLIGSRDGAALILTCWHIFREFGESAAVAVDLFPNGPGGAAKTYPGKLIRHDEKADVALVVITGCGVLSVSPLASTDQFPQPGDHVFSVGCGDGKAPSLEQHSVTRLNPYQGPSTTECTGMPVVGRSGGGLFDASGRVIGVCFAADRADQLGVYVGTAEIHKLLHEANYGALIPAATQGAIAGNDSPGGPAGPAAPSADSSNPFSTEPAEPINVVDLGSAAPQPATTPATPPEPPVKVAGGLQGGALPVGLTEAAKTALTDGTAMEATIILRPIDKPGAPSEVIVINRVSDRFRRYLMGEAETKPVETGLRVPSGSLDRSRLVTADLMIDASSATYVRSAASKPTGSVALLARIFDNHP